MFETSQKESALLVLIQEFREKWPVEVLAQEFKSLVISTGLEVNDLIVIKGREITPALYIGKGKAEELAVIAQEKNVNVVIFNNNLSFRQQRNLEDALGVKTIDRTQLILDIFSRHAHTQEGILQVELAQLEYLLPRLKGKGIALSRLGGGIGTRGPGEKKLEIDRRRITDRIARLKKELERLIQHRQTMRKKRHKEKISICSLVGYTNAGKSMLFNSLTAAGEKTEDSLFTTLGTVARTFFVRNNVSAVMSDTVGFIYKLPPNLVEAFKATLEELHYADVLLHVIDAATSDISRLMAAVNTILKELHLEQKPILFIFNKIDALGDQKLIELEGEYPQGIFVSALKKTNLDLLREKIYQAMFTDRIEVILKFPFSLMAVANQIHKNCEVVKTTYQEDKAVYLVRIRRDKIDSFRRQGVEVHEIEVDN